MIRPVPPSQDRVSSCSHVVCVCSLALHFQDLQSALLVLPEYTQGVLEKIKAPGATLPRRPTENGFQNNFGVPGNVQTVTL